MGLRQCDKCSEMVDEAKAFCPACGNAFVEEESRSVASNFEAMDNTVQLGQTMYNQMLSDMGLNISKVPDPPEKRVEVLTPASVPLAPAAPAASSAPQVKKPVEKPSSSGSLKWILIGGAVLIVLVVIVLIAAVLAYMYWLRSL